MIVEKVRPLTGQQRKCLGAIERLISEKGYPPSLREISAAMGLSPVNVHGVHGHVKALQRKGFIRAEPGVPRSIVILKSSEEADG